MINSYFDLIDQTYYFPQEGFDLRNEWLYFNGLSLQYLIEKYKTPFRLTYLPKVGSQIKKAKNLFNRAIRLSDYKGKYYYCYCTKCCHFSHVIKEALNHGVHLETSSSFDIDLIFKLFEAGLIDQNIILIHNGYKTDDYLRKIIKLNEAGFYNSVPVLDSMQELDRLIALTDRKLKVGIRMAINEESSSAYYTSRLGIRSSEIIDFYKSKIQDNPNLELKMLHFFVDSGIRDDIYYWGEFKRALQIYADLKKQAPSLRAINMGGGLPIRNNLSFNFDYDYMIREIVRNIKDVCVDAGIEEPDIFTEFGKYTVGESGAVIFSVLEQKQQNDNELWYMIDNSLMNTIPDSWSIYEKFILLPINKWNNEYTRVNIGGLSCDHSDYYNSEDLDQEIYLPVNRPGDKEPLYLGFFHTGAYQDAISGYGGIKHCLIPSPRHIVVQQDSKGNFVEHVYREEQTVDHMLHILGYSDSNKVLNK